MEILSTNITSPVSLHSGIYRPITMIKAAGDVPLSTTMKMIEDLGMQFATPTSNQPAHQVIWECPYCKKHFKARLPNVKNGNTNSCGCYQRKRIRESLLTHGLTQFKDYKTWCNIKDRTSNPNSPKFKAYGAKGIKLCDEWLNDPESFISYIYKLPNHQRKGYSIDRIDNDGNYEPGNIRYATSHVQEANKNIRAINTSGYIGVTFSKNTINHWQSRIVINRKDIYLGCYKTAKEAAIARNNYIIANNLTEYKLNDIK
jgi:hypothetical protein